MGFWDIIGEGLEEAGVFKYIIYAIVAVVVVMVVVSLMQLVQAFV